MFLHYFHNYLEERKGPIEVFIGKIKETILVDSKASKEELSVPRCFVPTNALGTLIVGLYI